jgi:1,4-dihydroxy-2-naphthoyl-CoA hydrolase
MDLIDAAGFNEFGKEFLPGHLGIVIDHIEPGRVECHLPIEQHHFAPNSYIHGGTVAAIADTACGYGSMATLPDGAYAFTTIELKINYFGTVRKGSLRCIATMLHGGRTTQVWDADVTDENGRVLAKFRCTNLMLYS